MVIVGCVYAVDAEGAADVADAAGEFAVSIRLGETGVATSEHATVKIITTKPPAIVLLFIVGLRGQQPSMQEVHPHVTRMRRAAAH
jgi:hypothetical protein